MAKRVAREGAPMALDRLLDRFEQLKREGKDTSGAAALVLTSGEWARVAASVRARSSSTGSPRTLPSRMTAV